MLPQSAQRLKKSLKKFFAVVTGGIQRGAHVLCSEFNATNPDIGTLATRFDPGN